MQTIRVLLAHDHELVRAGIRLLLEEISGIEVIGEAVNARDMIPLVEKYSPRVVLSDMALPGLIGLEVTRKLAQSFPMVRVVVLSMHADKEHFNVALRAGVAGYLLKDATREELESAIRTVARGESYLRPPLSKPEVMKHGGRANVSLTPLEGLSIRQTQVLQGIAQSKTTKQIALELNISVKTVEAHRRQLMDRLEIHDVPGLVRFAIKAGLVTTED
jgi:DNA-binding NarL/FixJ family response regulator